MLKEVDDKLDLDYKRLKKLHDFDLDYESLQEEFINFVELAANITGTRMSLINLIDNYTQWTVTTNSGELSQIDKQKSICNHTIYSEKFLEIPRIDKDTRFRNFDYAKGENGLKYYLGIPLRVESGESIGALCVVDHEEKYISAEKRELLELIASEIVEKLESKKRLNILERHYTEVLRQRNQVAHDVRGPLAGIIGLVKCANNEDLSQEESKSYFKMIGDSSRSLMELTDDILEKHKNIQLGKQFTLLEYKKRLENLYQPSAREKGINFLISIEESKSSIPFSRNKLIPIAGNIIANAIKFTEIGGEIYTDMRIEMENEKSFLLIQVKDNGRGISKEKLSSFRSAMIDGEKGTGGEKSYGLGLNLVNEMVEELRGELFIDSTEGVGTIIRIKIPI